MTNGYDGMAFTFENQKMILSSLFEGVGNKSMANYVKNEIPESSINMCARYLANVIFKRDNEIVNYLRFACFDI